MAKKGIGLAIAGGAALVILGSGKKKKKKKVSSDAGPELNLGESWMRHGGGDAEKLEFDAECNEIINKLNFGKHNEWLTNRFLAIRGSGVENPDEIAVALLKEQSEQCPWDDQSQWTTLMADLFGQLRDAVSVYMDAT